METAIQQDIRVSDFKIQIATDDHLQFAEEISHLIRVAAEARGIGISERPPEYIREKIHKGSAIIATYQDNQLAGFCYIETWTHGKYVANSGLIVSPDFRGYGLGRKIKNAAFNHSRTKYPDAKIFGITTTPAVMKINSDLGYRPVSFTDLTRDDQFWDGCQSCPNYDILTRNDRKNCLCTGMLYDPAEKAKQEKSAVADTIVKSGNGNAKKKNLLQYWLKQNGMRKAAQENTSAA